MSIRSADANAVLKEFYSLEDNLNEKLRGISPTISRFKTKIVGKGRRINHPLQKSSAQAVSADFGTAYLEAINNSLGPGYAKMQIGWDEYHAAWQADMKAMKQLPARGKGSFIHLTRRMIESTRETCLKVRTSHFFGDRVGNIGVVDDATTTSAADFKDLSGSNVAHYTKIVLADRSQLLQFERGTRFQVAGATASRVDRKGQTDKIFEVLHVEDQGEGTGEKEAAIYAHLVAPSSGIVAADLTIADDHLIFRVGDFANKGNYTPGIFSWCPDSLMNADNFFGVDRKIGDLSGVGRQTALAGYYFDATGAHNNSATDLKAFEKDVDRVLEAAAIAYQSGARCEYFACHPRTFKKLVADIGSKVEHTTEDDGLRVYTIHGGNGYVKLYLDPYCPEQEVVGLKHSDWTIVSLGEFIDIFNPDGNVFHRVPGQRMVNGMLSSYCALICSNLKNVVRIKVRA